MKILILEDSLERVKKFREKFIGHEVVVTEFSKECIKLLSENTYDAIFLDHDLGGAIMVSSGENTGYEVAEWLSKNPVYQPRTIIIHSFNPSGAKNMKAVLSNAIINPGAWL